MKTNEKYFTEEYFEKQAKYFAEQRKVQEEMLKLVEDVKSYSDKDWIGVFKRLRNCGAFANLG